MPAQLARNLPEATGTFRSALIGLGVVLFAITIIVNVGARRLVVDVRDLQWLSVLDRAAERIGCTRWLASDRRNQLIAQAIGRSHPQCLVQLVENIDHASLRVRKLDRLGNNGCQNRFEVEARIDRLGHLPKCAQLLDRACKLRGARLHLVE